MSHRSASLSCFALVLLAAARAAATEPATVHVVLHPRTSGATVATFVDIAVQGTAVPIRLVRRVAGVCATQPDERVLVRVTCGPGDAAAAVTFEVAREGNEVIVRRTGGGAEADPARAPQVIARGALPPHASVTVR